MLHNNLPCLPRLLPGLYPIFCSIAKPLFPSPRAVLRPSSRLSLGVTLAAFSALRDFACSRFFFSISSLRLAAKDIGIPGRISELDPALYKKYVSIL